jgi:hypothetical protein
MDKIQSSFLLGVLLSGLLFIVVDSIKFYFRYRKELKRLDLTDERIASIYPFVTKSFLPVELIFLLCTNSWSEYEWKSVYETIKRSSE